MALKAVLFDFNGIIINDEPIHEQLIEQILIAENLRPKRDEFRKFCLGRSDRACLKDILSRRGRVISETYLNQLISRKAQAYQERLAQMDELPIYPGLEEFILQLQTANLKIGVVTGALQSEVERVLTQANLMQYFSVIISADDLKISKPEPDGYLLGIELLNQHFENLDLQPSECLAIEDTPAGITAAKRAGMQVVGVANTYPFHIIQRQANWTVDYFRDLELERIQQVFSGEKFPSTVREC
ncbi:HAD family hydrolase [Aerosakkonemataceae cyanobacterium BLCC-F154]|uniref:HAD family hydrolase n=1 Tax=Floridaenema fluviatile BLCC-F154 TaxID=3153640 RepID=A0ABV4Y4T1_9CYAN